MLLYILIYDDNHNLPWYENISSSNVTMAMREYLLIFTMFFIRIKNVR